MTAGAPTAASRTVVSTSAGNPLRIAAVTAADKDLKPLVSRLESRGYVQTPAALCVLPGKGNGAAALAQTIETLRQSPCDAIAVSVSNRRDVPAVAAMLETVHPGSGQTTPRVLFAGPADAVAGLTERLQGTYALDHIGGDWTESALPDAKLDAALEQFRAPITAVDLGLPIRGQVEPSVDGPLSWDRLSPVMAGAFQGTVCIVDVGGSKTAVSVASPPGDGKPADPTATSQAALGTAGGLDDLLRFVDIDLVRAWLPFDISQDALRDYLANRRLLRGGIVSDNRQLMIDQAVARVCGLAARKMETRPDFLIATGGIATYPRIAQSVLTLLDIVQPLSPCRILVDRAGLLPRLGPLLRVDPEAALSLLKSDTFINCGVCLSLQGRLKPGEAIAEIGIQRTGASRDGETPEEVHTIRFGTITRIPLGPAEQAASESQPPGGTRSASSLPTAPGRAAPLSYRAPSPTLSPAVSGPDHRCPRATDRPTRRRNQPAGSAHRVAGRRKCVRTTTSFRAWTDGDSGSTDASCRFGKSGFHVYRRGPLGAIGSCRRHHIRRSDPRPVSHRSESRDRRCCHGRKTYAKVSTAGPDCAPRHHGGRGRHSGDIVRTVRHVQTGGPRPCIRTCDLRIGRSRRADNPARDPPNGAIGNLTGAASNSAPQAIDVQLLTAT